MAASTRVFASSVSFITYPRSVFPFEKIRALTGTIDSPALIVLSFRDRGERLTPNGLSSELLFKLRNNAAVSRSLVYAFGSHEPFTFSIRRSRFHPPDVSRAILRERKEKTNGGNVQSEGKKFPGYFSDARAGKFRPAKCDGRNVNSFPMYIPICRACNGSDSGSWQGGGGEGGESGNESGSRAFSAATRPLVSDTIHWTRESSSRAEGPTL